MRRKREAACTMANDAMLHIILLIGICKSTWSSVNVETAYIREVTRRSGIS